MRPIHPAHGRGRWLTNEPARWWTSPPRSWPTTTAHRHLLRRVLPDRAAAQAIARMPVHYRSTSRSPSSACRRRICNAPDVHGLPHVRRDNLIRRGHSTPAGFAQPLLRDRGHIIIEAIDAALAPDPFHTDAPGASVLNNRSSSIGSGATMTSRGRCVIIA
jgi:hypothetical protein